MEEKAAAKFLLTIALPCLEKDLNSEPTWRAGRSTWRILGGHWYHSMALASVLMDYFSKLENVMENIKPKGTSDSPTTEGPKQKKKRKRMVTKHEMETTITNLYYECSTIFLQFYDDIQHHEKTLKLWDKESGRRAPAVETASTRASIQPGNQQMGKSSPFDMYVEMAKINTGKMTPPQGTVKPLPEAQIQVTTRDGKEYGTIQ